MANQWREQKLPVPGRLVGRRITAFGDPRRSVTPRAAVPVEAAPDTPPETADGHTDLLGEPLHGDETAALGGADPSQGVANDYDDRPSMRRIGDGLVGDGVNLQGRPETSETRGDQGTGAGGGSGL